MFVVVAILLNTVGISPSFVYFYLMQNSCSNAVDIRLTGESKESPSPSDMGPLGSTELCFRSPRPGCRTTAGALCDHRQCSSAALL